MASNKKETSGSKKGLVFALFLIIVLSSLGAYFYLFHLNDEKQAIIEMPQTENIIQVEDPKEALGVTTSVQDAVAQPNKRSKTRYYKKSVGKGYYIRVASCQYKSCIRYNKSILKQKRFPISSFKKIGNTKYFHLVSTMAFKKDIAQRKVTLLAGLNKMPGSPAVFRHKNLYRISMGFFPDRDKGLFMQSYVDQFQGHTKTYFSLEPKIERFKYTNIYVGPFYSKKKTDKILERLQNSREFFNLEIIRNPKRDNRAVNFK